MRQNLPFARNPFFTGRQTLLEQLEQLFEQNARIAITQPISVSGLEGIGKTQLALEYAPRHYPHVYRSVLWVNAADRASLVPLKKWKSGLEKSRSRHALRRNPIIRRKDEGYLAMCFSHSHWLRLGHCSAHIVRRAR